MVKSEKHLNLSDDDEDGAERLKYIFFPDAHNVINFLPNFFQRTGEFGRMKRTMQSEKWFKNTEPKVGLKYQKNCLKNVE